MGRWHQGCLAPPCTATPEPSLISMLKQDDDNRLLSTRTWLRRDKGQVGEDLNRPELDVKVGKYRLSSNAELNDRTRGRRQSEWIEIWNVGISFIRHSHTHVALMSENGFKCVPLLAFVPGLV
jgi:hypothetical protein